MASRLLREERDFRLRMSGLEACGVRGTEACRAMHTKGRCKLSAQLLLGILRGPLPAGYKLPSVRELARRGTVWFWKRGSGVFVKSQPNVDAFVREWLVAAQTLGHSLADVREAFDRMATSSAELLVVDPDAELARILGGELREALGVCRK